jgi:hypothetical protein
MNFKNYKFSPHSFGEIMTGFASYGLTDKQKERLAELREKDSQSKERAELEAKEKEQPKLTKGGITYVRNIVRQHYLNYKERVETRPMDKGITCELAGIMEINQNEFTNYEKFPEGIYENDYLISKGCDIKQGRMTRDLKLSWSKKTHPLTKDEAYTSNNYWQGQGYMWIFDTDEHWMDHLLMSTPEELIGWEDPQLHDCDDLEWKKRYLTFKIDRNQNDIDLIPLAVKAARTEMDRYWNELNEK